ncbi:MAG: hypothetical protein GXY19_19550 [Phycisphaerae bacterium]|nr:hypothetical protein [Phycisphaerae bacterium]
MYQSDMSDGQDEIDRDAGRSDMDIRDQLNSEQWMQFTRAVRKAGIQTHPWWEAVEYAGPPKLLHIELCVSRASSIKEQVAAGNDYEALETIASYFGNIPNLPDWELSMGTGEWVLDRGHFAIVEKCAYRGGDREAVINLLRDFEVNECLIDHTLDQTEEKTLGYVLSSCAADAEILSEALTIGANSPDYEGTLTLIANLRRYGERAP